MAKAAHGGDGMKLLRQITAGTLDAADLTPEERRLVVDILDLEHASRTARNSTCYTRWDMAQLLKVCEGTISRDLAKLRRRRGRLVGESGLSDALGDLHRAKLIAQHGARSAGDYVTFWKVEQEYIAALQRLGALPEQAIEVAGTLRHEHAFSSYSVDATRRLLEIAAEDRYPRRDLPTDN